MKMLLTKVMYEKNISVRQLSNLTGIPKSTINNIMTEKYSPTLDNLERIARALKVGMVDLFELTVQMKKVSSTLDDCVTELNNAL